MYKNIIKIQKLIEEVEELNNESYLENTLKESNEKNIEHIKELLKKLYV